MIQCAPQGICSRNYWLTTAGHHASAEFNWCTEQGTLTIDGTQYQVCKQGMFSGKWALESGGEVVMHANKRSVLTRSFDIFVGQQVYLMSAASIFSRKMVITGNGADGMIAKVHAWTRRAKITGVVPDFRVACFGFWLTALMWRREEKSASG
ncbi:hypothetical protein K227x_10980 [Rubripirellula lacrimiformis]|uniref:Uncharacterized protein n=1 Tax=Rubripirellula lacrimiformis TaxID=1930273 RepID=A0A517N6G1_9BACT|nr:hypothetical protein [Rubripirellula lacrimiformis]QDT02720.1 hypothetical protein K227x_10980 [Rubripirellula lacrimiformis]